MCFHRPRSTATSAPGSPCPSWPAFWNGRDAGSTIQRTEDRVRVTARLVDVHSAKLVWSESYEYPVQLLAEAQNRAARDIAVQVRAHLELHGRLLPAKP